MTKEQFVAIQQAMSFTNVQMAAVLGISVQMIVRMRYGTRPVSKRVEAAAKNALSEKIVELQRLRLFLD